MSKVLRIVSWLCGVLLMCTSPTPVFAIGCGHQIIVDCSTCRLYEVDTWLNCPGGNSQTSIFAHSIDYMDGCPLCTNCGITCTGSCDKVTLQFHVCCDDGSTQFQGKTVCCQGGM